MNIYLIRHGEREDGEDNKDSSGLTDKGMRQSELLGKRLMKYGIENIYSSDMVRALQTAYIINKYLSVEILPRHDLREIDMGAFSRGWEFLNEFHPTFSEKFSKHVEDVPYPGGENGLDVMLRSGNVINEILETSCENVAIVAHVGTIRVLLCGILGLGQARRFLIGAPIENCSISVIKYDKKSGTLSVHTVNDYAHVEDLIARHQETTV